MSEPNDELRMQVEKRLAALCDRLATKGVPSAVLVDAAVQFGVASLFKLVLANPSALQLVRDNHIKGVLAAFADLEKHLIAEAEKTQNATLH